MNEYLTKEGLEQIAAEYRQQSESAESFTGLRRAEGAAMAIEYLINTCYPPALELALGEQPSGEHPSGEQPSGEQP